MNIIVINGPMGVGKTTVGKYIADTNEGTAFIDGDWCFDIHPFVGNEETKFLAIDNILHMLSNYKTCSVCEMVVLVWLMDDEWVQDKIFTGIRELGLDLHDVTLICDEENLRRRWFHDGQCEWRTDEWFKVSIKALQYFSRQDNRINSNGMTVDEIAEKIMVKLQKPSAGRLFNTEHVVSR